MKKLIYILATISIGIAACGGGSEKKPTETTEQKIDPSTLPVKEIIMNTLGNSMAEMKYDITEIRATAGQKVKITLNNKATDETMIHNMVIIQPGTAEKVGLGSVDAGLEKEFVVDDPAVIAHSGLVKPGETTTFEFTAPATPGEYEFICSYPGHYMMMKGKFIVE
jgi:azurin